MVPKQDFDSFERSKAELRDGPFLEWGVWTISPKNSSIADVANKNNCAWVAIGGKIEKGTFYCI